MVLDFLELEKEEMQKLLAIQKPEDIKTTEVLETWDDDHEVCAGAEINSVKIAFWHCGTIAGAIAYATDSPRARKDLFEYLVGDILEHEPDEEGTSAILVAFIKGAATPVELQAYVDSPFAKKYIKDYKIDYRFDEASLLTHADSRVREAAKKYFQDNLKGG
jgi:hypothetical protein